MQAAFILVRPQLSENVGTALRALWNCGQTDLRLIAPREPWPGEKGLNAAAGAASQAHHVRTFPTLQAATVDLHHMLATTVRPRDMVKPVCPLEELSPHLKTLKAGQNDLKVGFLFGPERMGLTSDDLSWAQSILTIPLNPDYGSLNLAQCVLLVAHELWRLGDLFAPTKTDASPIATQDALQGALEHLESTLKTSGFFFPKIKEVKMRLNIRNMFTRASLTDQEVRTLRGIARHFEKILEGRIPKLLQPKKESITNVHPKHKN